ANGLQIDQQTAITNYISDASINQNTNFILQATHSGEAKTVDFKAVVRPSVQEAPVPAGMLDGINLDPLDPTKATLVFYAPFKDFVYLIGSFNNWDVDDAYLMNKDSSQDRF